ncbi:heat shock protein HtpX [Halovenus aranensis]|jgi:heat shock protein HtpX|uniref:Protease HtpX homolog n=1 Tax=Halovenus aranensis TaxID=890420 RepID=A0A1G8WC20_9EURY|nr:M48 family metalloprotease [Halovenus aranensis]SDJ75315.1 heat shock protein HtpX [Halovenus aranensis]
MRQRYSWGLGVRMALTLLALGGLYIGLGYGVALLFGVFVGSTGIGHFVGIALAVLLLVGGQYYYGANLALRSLGGRVVEREEYPDLHSRVTALARQADVPKPRVAVAENKTPNAFAAGRKQSDAVICVTTGLLSELDDEEIDAVLAHELSHVVNRDFQLMTGITALSIMAGWIVRWGFLFGDGGGGGEGGGAQMLAGYVAALFVWVGAFFVGRLVSRYREYAADRGAATLTGDPTAMISALETISDELESVPEDDLREAEQANALLAAEVRETRLGSLFRTHPAVEDRVEKLRDLAVDMN